MPETPWTWLVSAGRFRTIDRLRRQARFNRSRQELVLRIEGAAADEAETEPEELPDDSLRLIFTCCHPLLPPDAQIALTLREVCGLTTEEIAKAYLIGVPTMAQRIVRAKARIREAAVPYEVPPRAELPDRLDAVLRVIYLVFNEGYSAATTRLDLAPEAIRLGRLLVGLLPDPEALGLLALMLFHDSRRSTRVTATGDLVLLADQDRSLWDRQQIEEASGLLERALAGPEIGSYTLQAAIAAVSANAPTAEATDWARIVQLYDMLATADPSPVVELNRAAAIAMRDGPDAGLALMDRLVEEPALSGYHFAHAARAELLRRLGRNADAATGYRRALSLARQVPDQRFLERRLAELAREGNQGVASSAAISSTSDS